MSLFEHLFKVLSLYFEAWIRIRIKVKGRIRICIKVTSRIRISIKVIHNTVCNIIAPNLQMHLHGIYFSYTYKCNASIVVMQYVICENRSMFWYPYNHAHENVCTKVRPSPPSVCLAVSLSVCLPVCLSVSFRLSANFHPRGPCSLSHFLFVPSS
jgi:hypothetical protein